MADSDLLTQSLMKGGSFGVINSLLMEGGSFGVITSPLMEGGSFGVIYSPLREGGSFGAVSLAVGGLQMTLDIGIDFSSVDG